MLTLNIKVRKNDDTGEYKSYYKVVAIKEEGVGLVGPNKDNNYLVISHDDFDKDWKIIWCTSPSGHENEECHMKFSKRGKVPAGSDFYSLVCSFCGRDNRYDR